MEALECIKTRRSIRKFTEQPVTEDEVRQIVEAAAFAPSWKNTQIARYIVVTDKEKKDKLADNCMLGFAYNQKTTHGAPALVVLTMGLETGYFRFAGQAATERERKEVFETTWGAVSLFALLFFAAALLFTPALARIMDYAEHPSYIRLTAAIIALDAATAIPFARLRQQGRAKRFVALRLLSVAVNLALTVFFYSALPALASRGLDAGTYDPAFGAGYVLVANLLGSAVVWVGLYPSCHGARPRIRPKLLRAVMLYSLPLLISGIAGTANEFIDRQMIKYLLPPESSMDALGIYGAVAKLGVVLMLFTQMYRYAAEPYFLSAFRQEDFRRSNAEALKYFIIVSVGIFLTIMLFVDLFGLLMGRDFRQGIRVLPIILLANMFSGIWLNLSFWYKREEKTSLAIVVTGAGLVSMLVFGFWCIPVWGYYGAAWARLASESTMVAVSWWLNRRFYPTPYDWRRIGEYVAAALAVFAVCEAVTACGGNKLIAYAFNIVLFAAYALYLVRRERIDVAALVKAALKRK